MSIFGEPTRSDQLRSRLREQIRRLAVEEFDGADVQVPIGDSGRTRPGLGDPLAGVRAAVRTRDVAAALAQDYVREARAAGRSWAEVAEALGIGEDEDRSGAERAFDEVAETWDRFRGPRVWWTCAACGARVTDTGPYASSHPDDTEHGHAEDCARHNAAITAWTQQMGDDL